MTRSSSRGGRRTLHAAHVKAYVVLACLTALVAALGAPWKWY